jgi:4-hydroxybenzoate polyprenyltransferase
MQNDLWKLRLENEGVFVLSDRLIKSLLISMRPQQWYKNFIVFIGIIFSLNIYNMEMWFYTIFVFIAFCLISGSIYIINDVKDVEMDRLHPKKMYRPIASGELSPRAGLLVSVPLLVALTLALFYINSSLGLVGILYVLMNLIYTFFLKELAIIDVMVVAVGFVLRAAAGAIVIDVQISHWLILCVFLMALVLAFGKRRHELLTSSSSRACLSQYTEKMVDNFLNISVAMLLMSYALYSFFVNFYMMATLPFAFYGVFRFMQLVYLNNLGGEAEIILKDRISQVNLALWLALVILILYGGPT